MDIRDDFYDLRALLDERIDNNIEASLSIIFHEIEREITFVDQQLRIFETLKNNENEKNDKNNGR